MAPPRPARLAVALTVALAMCAGASSALGAPMHRHHSHHGHNHHRRRCANTELQPNGHNLRLIRAATLCLVNHERALRGEAPLRSNPRLRRAAQGHSASMAYDDYFEHYGGGGPGGGTPLSRMRAAGYISSSRVGFEVGENIAWATSPLSTPRSIVAAWMASPGHRANILDPHYRETGIGVSPHPLASLAQGQPGAIYTQDFGVIIGR